MANLCYMLMKVVGKKDDIFKFYDALTHRTTEVWLGRGAHAELKFVSDGVAIIQGEVKNTMASALVESAESMEFRRRTGEGCWCWTGDIVNVSSFLTVFDAAEKFGVNFDAYSQEPALGIQEHFAYDNGVKVQESISWQPWEEGSVGYSWNFKVSEPER